MKEIISNILITIIGTTTLVSYVPQIIHLIKVKESTGVSILSWLLWTSTNACYIIYLILNWDLRLFLASLLEIICELLIIFLTILYRKKKKP